MGKRAAVAAAAISREASSSCSAESSFRELDDVFLQSQTRIWLGEVLGTRLDEEVHIADLLQDGELLSEVSKLVWNLLLAKYVDLRHLKNKNGPFSSKKSSGRYRPYSNVDSFLKICKILGLNGIDLFSPSDVVEKRDIRKVCICLRALSKKTRSKQLNVPDFDMVTYTVAMPTDMVGGIRRSLETSQCSVSTSSSYSSNKGSRSKAKEKTLHVSSHINDDSCSEESDEAESRYMGENSELNPESETPRAASLANGRCMESRDDFNGQYMKESGENDDETGENYISDYLAFSDLMVHATDGKNPVLLNGENNIFDFFLNVDAKGLNSRTKVYQKKFSDDDASSTTSVGSVLGRVLTLEFDESFDVDESSTTNTYSPEEGESKNRISTSPSDCEEPQRKMALNDLAGLAEPLSFSVEKGQLATEHVSENLSCSSVKDANFVDESNNKSQMGYDEDTIIASENGNKGKVDGNLEILAEKNSDKGTKHGKKGLLKNVAKGTAVVGVLFLLLQIRNKRINGKGTLFDKISEFGSSKLTSRKKRTEGRSSGMYPTENIKF